MALFNLKWKTAPKTTANLAGGAALGCSPCRHALADAIRAVNLN
ncbi:MAG: hypothetical protein ACK4Q5_04105 [Saprospiraceae bacterium]